MLQEEQHIIYGSLNPWLTLFQGFQPYRFPLCELKTVSDINKSLKIQSEMKLQSSKMLYF